MNTLELKGGMIEMIANVNDKALLEHLYEVMASVITDTATDNIELTPEQKLRLNADIEASFLPENLVEHEVALQKMSRWLKK